MGWTLTFALIVVSIAAVSALVAGAGAQEDESVVREEAAKQLSALREHLLGR